MTSKTYYVFVSADGSYRLGQAGEIASAAAVPISKPYPSMALAHDNLNIAWDQNPDDWRMLIRRKLTMFAASVGLTQ
jgi:hypothetical protein